MHLLYIHTLLDTTRYGRLVAAVVLKTLLLH